MEREIGPTELFCTGHQGLLVRKESVLADQVAHGGVGERRERGFDDLDHVKALPAAHHQHVVAAGFFVVFDVGKRPCGPRAVPTTNGLEGIIQDESKRTFVEDARVEHLLVPGFEHPQLRDLTGHEGHGEDEQRKRPVDVHAATLSRWGMNLCCDHPSRLARTNDDQSDAHQRGQCERTGDEDRFRGREFPRQGGPRKGDGFQHRSEHDHVVQPAFGLRILRRKQGPNTVDRHQSGSEVAKPSDVVGRGTFKLSIPARYEEEDEAHGDAGPSAHAEGQHGAVHPSRLIRGFRRRIFAVQMEETCDAQHSQQGQHNTQHDRIVEAVVDVLTGHIVEHHEGHHHPG